MPIRPIRHPARARPRPGLARLDRPALLASIVIGLAALCLGFVVIGVRMRSVRAPERDAEIAAPPQATEAAAPASAGVPGERSSAATAAATGDGTPGESTTPATRSGANRASIAAEKHGDQGIAQYGALPRSWRDSAPLIAQLAAGPHPPAAVAARLPRVIATVPASALGFAWPLRGYVTSSFDDQHPLGIDIAPADSLGLVLAARDGRVLIAGGDPCCSYGYFVLLDHGDGLTSIYGHFRDPPSVRAGEWVERGTVLGVAGDTGHSFGVHLHFEVRLNGVPMDPRQVLTAGFLSPLVPRAPSPSLDPAPDRDSNPPAREPETDQPDGAAPPPMGDAADSDEAPDASPAATPTPTPDPGRGEAAPSPSPTTAPTLSASPVATVAPSLSPSLPPTAPPSAAPAATPSASASPMPSVTGTPAPSSPPVPTASGPTASPSATPTVSPSPSASPTPSASPSPSATPTPTPTPVPCVAVRYQPGGGPPAVSGAPTPFIGLEVEVGRVGSLVAERCGTDAPARITAQPVAGERCSAGLYAAPDTLVRALRMTATPDGQGVRWTVEASDVTPGAIVRVACSPENERGGG